MKFSEQWLREWVNPDVSTAELTEQLTMAGLEVDSVEPAAPEFEGVVVAAILTAAKHPEADRLQVCEVSTGEGQPLQIVCGAANARPGIKVPLAQIGAYLPGDIKIKRSKLRGIESEGMLCSAKEIGLAADADGLLELPDDAIPGTSIREYLNLDDQLIEIDLTPNRGDCLSVAGIAREVGVLNRIEVVTPETQPVKATIDDMFPVNVDSKDACPRYLGRVIRGISKSAKSPDWLVERLRRSGLNSISPSVDVTNFILLEYGQPMHAFDLGKLKHGITVRYAGKNEKLVLLDGKEITLGENSLVIADNSGPLALAGIMGGLESSVTDATNDLFLECAFFSPDAIAGRAREYGLHTDSSHRFERGVDPELQHKTLERATALLLDIVGGSAGPVIEAVSTRHLPQRPPIRLRASRAEKILGIKISDTDITDILQRLGMQLAATDDGWTVTPPGYRFDINIEVDLIEELGRIYGYSRIPTRSLSGHIGMVESSEHKLDLRRIRSLLTGRGYDEAVTYSFIDPVIHALISPDVDVIKLANPISVDLSEMRTSLWPGLIRACQYNQARQIERVRLFETGLVFVREQGDIKQTRRLAGLVSGDLMPEQWGVEPRKSDFYSIKSDVEALFGLGAGLDDVRFTADVHPALHPGQSACIIREDQVVGWVGKLHPNVTKTADLCSDSYVFELDLDGVEVVNIAKFREISRFPVIRRDIAVIVDENISAEEVTKCVQNSAGELLKDLTLFDVYRGKGIDSGRKSLALGLTLGTSSRTLKEEDVEAVIEGVVSTLHNNLGATLRE